MSVELLQTLSLVAYILAGLLFLVAVVLFFYLKVPALWGEVTGRTARKAIKAMKWKNTEANPKPIPNVSSSSTGANLSAKLAEAAHLQGEDPLRESSPSQDRVPLVAAEQKPPLKTAPVAQEPRETADKKGSLLPSASEIGSRAKDTPEHDSGLPIVDDIPGQVSASSKGEDILGQTSTLSKGEDILGQTSVLSPAEDVLGQTSVLSAADDNSGQTSVLSPADGATDLLNRSGIGETAVLNASAYNEAILHTTGELPRADETTLLNRNVIQQQSTQIDPYFVMEKELAFTDSTEIIE